MAGEDRAKTTALALLQLLKEKPYSFGFFQALREIECAYPDNARIGTSSKPTEDPVRFGHMWKDFVHTLPNFVPNAQISVDLLKSHRI